LVGVGAAVMSAIVVGFGFYIYYGRQRKKNHLLTVTSFKGIPHSSSLEDSEKGSKYFGVHFFTYGELEEATNFFDPGRELGDGGFGKVYFGKTHHPFLLKIKFESFCWYRQYWYLTIK